MPLGNPNFIDLDPRIVAADRERFRQLRIVNEAIAIGQVAVESLLVDLTTQEGTAAEEDIDYHKIDPVLVAGGARQLAFQPY